MNQVGLLLLDIQTKLPEFCVYPSIETVTVPGGETVFANSEDVLSVSQWHALRTGSAAIPRY